MEQLLHGDLLDGALRSEAGVFNGVAEGGGGDAEATIKLGPVVRELPIAQAKVKHILKT
jgi:hypothetical protein